MKICYLILAHNNFIHLDRLIEALSDENTMCYIHLDKKIKDQYCPPNERTVVIPQQIDIKWGGFSMVEATIALMQYATEHFAEADYYGLISGVDYPIRSKEFLHQELSKNKQFIDILPAPFPQKPIERYTYYHFDYDRRNFNKLNPKGVLERMFKFLKIKRNVPFKIYVGSQWFFLTNECVKYILDTIRNDKKYVQFFSHALVPDEAFFQTIIGNSPFLSQTTANLTYTDWTVPVPPATITEQHVEMLKTKFVFNHEYGCSYPYFARKFNDNSIAVVQKIESELRK